jgi:hypothetical protein
VLKFNWVLSTLLVSAAIASELPTQSMQRAVAQTNLFQSREVNFRKLFAQRQEDNNPTAGIPGGGGSLARASWETIFGNLLNQQQDNNPSGNQGTGAGRGGVCALTPSPFDTQMEIWNNRPLFVLRQGLPPIKRVEVGLPGSNGVLDREVPLAPVGTPIVMNGGEKPLQIGQTYEWRLFIDSSEKSPPYKTTKFRVMDGPQRDRIKTDLEKIEKEFQGATAENIAWERAKYFAQKQLWSDVLQEVYSVKNPSPELKEKVQSMTGEVCLKLMIEQNAARSR